MSFPNSIKNKLCTLPHVLVLNKSELSGNWGKCKGSSLRGSTGNAQTVSLFNAEGVSAQKSLLMVSGTRAESFTQVGRHWEI